MSIANRICWIIERNLRTPLTLSSLAEASGVSRFHLAHAFGEATGRSVMTYLRGRRLTEAAKALASGAPVSILDLALDHGYGSHEAFTRAFRDAFGLAPDALRLRGTLEGLALVPPMALPAPARSLGAAHAAMPLDMRRVTIAEPWTFVGIAAATAFEDLVKVIPAQWARFMPRVHEIADIADPIPWGISRGVDDEGRLDYCSAMRVRGTKGSVPNGMVRVSVPPRTYAVFRHSAHVSRLGETYDAIWTRWQHKSGETIADPPSLEQHCEGFDPLTGEGGVDVWMPLGGNIY